MSDIEGGKRMEQVRTRATPLPVRDTERRRQYLFVPEAEERLGVSRFTLREWRRRKYGPGWTRIERRIVYPLPAVEKFEAELLARAGVQTA